MKKITASLKTICLVISLLTLPLLSGCKASKTFVNNQKDRNLTQVDASVVEQGSVSGDIDRRLISQLITEWRSMNSQQQTKQDTEEIQETITTTTDSAGITTKKEQRTTNRVMASQSTQSAADWGREYKYTIDSLSRRISALESKNAEVSSLEESESDVEMTEKKSTPQGSFPGWASIVLMVGVLIFFCVILHRISRLCP